MREGTFHFTEHFDDVKDLRSSRRWTQSAATIQVHDGDVIKYAGIWTVEAPLRPMFRLDKGLVLKSKVTHAAIAAKLKNPFVFGAKPLVVQYEVQLQVSFIEEEQ